VTDVKLSSEFENFLKKYNIKDYSLLKHERSRYVIFNNEDNYYYKLSIDALQLGAAENDLHYFLNNAHFPNHLVSSIIDTELNIWIIKSSPAPGRLVQDILYGGSHENKLDKNFIIKMMEWFKWQHTESRRLFPKITDKYFICLGTIDEKYPKDIYSLVGPGIDLNAYNVIYDEETHRYTPIDFEIAGWVAEDEYSRRNWVAEDEYSRRIFNTIKHVMTKIFNPNLNNSNGWLSIRQYPKVLDYCIEYMYKEIL